MKNFNKEYIKNGNKKMKFDELMYIILHNLYILYF